MARKVSQFSGGDLVEIILACGMLKMSAREITYEFANLGFTVPEGSMRRALSKARGTWAGGGTLVTIQDIDYVRGSRIFSISKLYEDTYQYGDEVVGGLDIRNQISGEHSYIPLHYLVWGQEFYNKQGIGGKIGNALRSRYEEVMTWVYKYLGIEGSEAREWLEDVLDAVRDFFDSNEIYPLEPILIAEDTMPLQDAINQIKGWDG